MNLEFQKQRADGRGFTLIETLVYISVLFIILELAFVAMYRSMDASTGLRRNASDITRALDAGERWREDVRGATQPLRLEHMGDNESVLHIPQTHGEVAYRFSSNSVARQAGHGEWFPLLNNVQASNFIADPREKVAAWRWELELRHYRKSLTQMRPLFTFISVAGGDSTK